MYCGSGYIGCIFQKAFFSPSKNKALHLAAPLAQHDKTPSPKSGCGTARCNASVATARAVPYAVAVSRRFAHITGGGRRCYGCFPFQMSCSAPCCSRCAQVSAARAQCQRRSANFERKSGLRYDLEPLEAIARIIPSFSSKLRIGLKSSSKISNVYLVTCATMPSPSRMTSGGWMMGLLTFFMVLVGRAPAGKACGRNRRATEEG